MSKKLRVVKKAVTGELFSSMSIVQFVDKMASPICIVCEAIQLEIPDLAPAQCSRNCLTRKAPLKKKREPSASHKRNIVIDPRQLQLAFAEA
jgi:hypothetical protein